MRYKAQETFGSCVEAGVVQQFHQDQVCLEDSAKFQARDLKQLPAAVRGSEDNCHVLGTEIL